MPVDGEDTLRTDVFLLGAALYAEVTGQPPFGHPPDPERVKRGAVIPPRHLEPGLPPHHERAILAALNADPRLRPADAAALAVLWRGAQAVVCDDLVSRARAVAARRTASGRFPSTRWSMVLRAGGGGCQALEGLCQAYWYPLYAFARRQGCEPEEAEDAVQGFFADVLGRDDLATVAPGRGRFRSWLLLAMKRWLLKGWRSERTQKRGGGRDVVSLDARDAEGRLLHEPVDLGATAEELFDRDWARQVLQRARSRVEEDYGRRGQAVQFAVLAGAIEGRLDRPHADIAATLGLTVGTVKVAAHRLRKRFAASVRAEIAETVADPAAIESELRELRLELG